MTFCLYLMEILLFLIRSWGDLLVLPNAHDCTRVSNSDSRLAALIARCGCTVNSNNNNNVLQVGGRELRTRTRTS
ncbi:hypothetical protein GQ44DRAFT_70097 [Phaeosphaeriaceae sp. PMI808]|nr:hypothetical protein GQ44DRAFT_70097 [Phaeosphaeriaceae sp. PMI808]